MREDLFITTKASLSQPFRNLCICIERVQIMTGCFLFALLNLSAAMEF